jgi:hypothetical protein
LGARSHDGDSSLLKKTLVVALGEFGRTPGPLNSVQGRDHWALVKVQHGGRVIGATDAQAARITKFDWGKNCPIYPKVLSETVYSMLGID